MAEVVVVVLLLENGSCNLLCIAIEMNDILPLKLVTC